MDIRGSLHDFVVLFGIILSVLALYIEGSLCKTHLFPS